MNIVCPNCGTSYDVDGSALGESGRTVRCVRCRETWHARVDDMARADALVQAAEDIGWDQADGRPAGATSAHAVGPVAAPEAGAPSAEPLTHKFKLSALKPAVDTKLSLIHISEPRD